MASPLIGPKALTVNPEAQQLHETGLIAELSGDYARAHESFDAARQVIISSPETTVDGIVQLARINRDDGFTYLRTATAEANPSILDQARQAIERSVEATAPLVSGTAFIGNSLPQPQETPKKVRREILAEHGVTVSLLGRLVTVKEVMLGVDTRGDSEVARLARDVEQQPYGLAHDILRLGNNGYYRVINAMVGARQERLNGRFLHTVVWLGRAANGLVWTAIRDPQNLKAAVYTTGNRIRHLRSYKAAVTSALNKP
jgi:hypothetical protein